MRRMHFKRKPSLWALGWCLRCEDGAERIKFQTNWLVMWLVSVGQWQSISRICWGPGFDSRLGQSRFFLFLPKLHFQFPFLPSFPLPFPFPLLRPFACTCGNPLYFVRTCTVTFAVSNALAYVYCDCANACKTLSTWTYFFNNAMIRKRRHDQPSIPAALVNQSKRTRPG